MGRPVSHDRSQSLRHATTRAAGARDGVVSPLRVLDLPHRSEDSPIFGLDIRTLNRLARFELPDVGVIVSRLDDAIHSAVQVFRLDWRPHIDAFVEQGHVDRSGQCHAPTATLASRFMRRG
jgi:hypothetical protein